MHLTVSSIKISTDSSTTTPMFTQEKREAKLVLKLILGVTGSGADGGVRVECEPGGPESHYPWTVRQGEVPRKRLTRETL